jgi:hypothetical protein
MSEEAENSKRRLRIVRIDEEQMLSVFEAVSEKCEFLSVPKFEKLPKGYVVRAVQYNFRRMAFDFLIQHDEFSPVPDGAEVPIIGSSLGMEATVYRRLPSSK